MKIRKSRTGDSKRVQKMGARLPELETYAQSMHRGFKMMNIKLKEKL